MVHQYQLNGYNIVLDTCSGSIHVVDEVAYDIIALFEGQTEDEIIAAMLKKYAGHEDVTEQDLRGTICHESPNLSLSQPHCSASGTAARW